VPAATAAGHAEDGPPPPPARRRGGAGRVQKNFGAALAERGATAAVAFDEGRFGLKPWCRRRWCPRGARPPWLGEDRYEWGWLYGAVEPLAGRLVCWLLPGVDGACLEAFLGALRRRLPGGRVAVVLDNSGSHRSEEVAWPAGLAPVPLPAYRPELNPAEQVLRHVRARLANRLFAALGELEAAIADALRELWTEPAAVTRLTAYPWWRVGLDPIAPPSP
jgi:transposase